VVVTAGTGWSGNGRSYDPAVLPVDVGTTGNPATYLPQPTTTAPPSFSQNPLVQIEGGVLEGLFLGFIPFGAVAEQVLTGTGALRARYPGRNVGSVHDLAAQHPSLSELRSRFGRGGPRGGPQGRARTGGGHPLFLEAQR